MSIWYILECSTVREVDVGDSGAGVAVDASRSEWDEGGFLGAAPEGAPPVRGAHEEHLTAGRARGRSAGTAGPEAVEERGTRVGTGNASAEAEGDGEREARGAGATEPLLRLTEKRECSDGGCGSGGGAVEGDGPASGPPGLSMGSAHVRCQVAETDYCTCCCC